MITTHGWLSFPFDSVPIVHEGKVVFASGHATVDYEVDAPDPSVGAGAECDWKIDDVTYHLSDEDGDDIPVAFDDDVLFALDDQVIKFLIAAQSDSISEDCHEDACW